MTRKDSDMVSLPYSTLAVLWNTLNNYGNECTYVGERIGGVLAGCMRAPPPTPAQLTHEAIFAKRLLEDAMKDIDSAPAAEPAADVERLHCGCQYTDDGTPEAILTSIPDGGLVRYSDWQAERECAEKAEARIREMEAVRDADIAHAETSAIRANARADRLAGLLRADRQEMELLQNLLEESDADCLGDGEDEEGRTWALREEAIDRLSKRIRCIDAELGDSHE